MTIAKPNNNGIKNGIVAFNTSSGDVSATHAATNRPMPIGGVIIPIMRLKQIITPKWT